MTDESSREDRIARSRTETRPTVRIELADIADVPDWPLARAALERLGPYALESFRAGLCAQLVRVTCELESARSPEERAALVVRARELLEAVAKVLDR